MTAPCRRGVCPGLSVPMPTGDGLLVRLIPAAPVPLEAMAGFCEAARRHGNGTIEISARGSLQVRGLTPRSAPLFAAAVADLGVAVQEGVPVIAGIDDNAAELLAAELRRAIADARLALSPKVSVVVDADGPLHLDALAADVRLRIVGTAQGPQFSAPQFHLGIGGDGDGERTAAGVQVAPTWLGTVASKDTVGAVIRILSIIAARGPTTRAADILRCEGVAAFRNEAAVNPAPTPPPRTPADMIGCHATRDGTMTLGVGLAFGHAHADALAELVRLAVHHGAQALRLAPDRTLLLIGISAPNARDLTAEAERLGFVVHSNDPRRRIAACPGAPACASGLIPARALASTLAPVLAPILNSERSGAVVHISGCPKGCAHPAPAALTLVGTPQGCGVIHDGSAHAPPHHYVDPASLGDDISRFATESMEVMLG